MSADEARMHAILAARSANARRLSWVCANDYWLDGGTHTVVRYRDPKHPERWLHEAWVKGDDKTAPVLIATRLASVDLAKRAAEHHAAGITP